MPQIKHSSPSSSDIYINSSNNEDSMPLCSEEFITQLPSLPSHSPSLFTIFESEDEEFISSSSGSKAEDSISSIS